MPAKSVGVCQTRNLALRRFLRQMAVRQKTRSIDRRRPSRIPRGAQKNRGHIPHDNMLPPSMLRMPRKIVERPKQVLVPLVQELPRTRIARS
eukprot:scaffold104326_cov33-Phaeocystis_antarctica.AAC.1